MFAHVRLWHSLLEYDARDNDPERERWREYKGRGSEGMGLSIDLWVGNRSIFIHWPHSTLLDLYNSVSPSQHFCKYCINICEYFSTFTQSSSFFKSVTSFRWNMECSWHLWFFFYSVMKLPLEEVSTNPLIYPILFLWYLPSRVARSGSVMSVLL